MAKILSKHHSVDLLTVVENRKEEKHSADLRTIFDQVICFRHSKAREYFGAWKILFSPRPLQVGYFHSRKMASWIATHHRRYDLLYCSTVRSAEYVKTLKTAKVIDFVDAISLNYREAVKYTRGFWKAVYTIEMRRLPDYERHLADHFDMSFITARKDRDHIHSGGRPGRLVVPNGVKTDLLKRSCGESEDHRIAFLGKLDYRPNEDACIFFVRDVFPRIRKAVPGLEFDIVGMNATKKIRNLQKHTGVNVTGSVDDPYRYLERSKIVIAPIRFGAGIQNKILEAMALGKAVLTTPVGAGGISGAMDGEHLIIADHNGPEEMAGKIIRLLGDDAARRRIGVAARELISKNYTWAHAEKLLLGSLSSILTRQPMTEES
jgi:polysaccharide biosynthesis protein PslH